MAKLIWRFQAIFYHGFRRNPVSSRLLKTENEMITLLLECLPVQSLGTVLDLGCGSGNSLSLLPFRAGTIAALDYSLAMLRYAKRFFPHIYFLNANTCSLPVKENRVDLIICIGLLEYIRDITAFFDEIYSVLKPRMYAIITVSPPSWGTNLRRLLGHRIYARDDKMMRNIFKRHSFIILKQEKTWLQQQFLIQKQA
jgi:ubiquinone/menaquinone biosynthesis C-methylase UbiE